MKSIKLISEELSEKDKLKSKIRDKFIKKPSAVLTLNLKNGTKLRVEYMFGGKYSIRRKDKNGASDISVLIDLDGLIDVILKEKRRFKW